MGLVISNFKEPRYAFLSNFYCCDVEHEGLIYPSAEHAYQAAKTLNMKARLVFTLEHMPSAWAKWLGKEIVIRPNWDKVKLEIMTEIVRKKFAIPELRGMLMSTGEAFLIEGNTWGDTFWGVCNGKGTNHLGKILMDIRSRTC